MTIAYARPRRSAILGLASFMALLAASLVLRWVRSDLGERVHGYAWIAFLVSLVLWLAWVYRAARNIRALHPDAALRYSPAEAVGGWFIPILGLIRPYQTLREIAAHSLGDPSPIERLLPILWWALFLGYAATAALRTTALRWSVTLEGVTGLLAGAAAIAVVWRVNRGQSALARARGFN